MATYSVNKVMLIGNLTRDPELRYIPQGAAVCSFGLATNRQWTTPDGETREDVEFHNIVAWRKLAEICAQILSKGRKVYLSGRLQTRDWTGDDGVKRYRTEVVIDEMIALDSPPAGRQPATAPPVAKASAQDTPLKEKKGQEDKVEKKDEVGEKEKGGKAGKPASAEALAGKEEVSPDDIPF